MARRRKRVVMVPTGEWCVYEGRPTWHQARAGHTSAAVTSGFRSKADAEEYAQKLQNKLDIPARVGECLRPKRD